MKPHGGIVLDRTDPRAWAQTLAFPANEPDPEAVKKHVAWCEQQGLLSDSVPVLWDFGRVWWQTPSSLWPYEEDLAAWREAREAKLRGYQRGYQRGYHQ